MNKFAKIKKHPNKNEWTVFSEKGKRMGTYTTLGGAKKRLRQIEYFKHVKNDNIIEPIFHGKKPSFLDIEVKQSSLNDNFEKRSEDIMRQELVRLSRQLRLLRIVKKAEEIAEMAEAIETSTSKTPLVKDLNMAVKSDKVEDKDLKSGMITMLAYLRAMQAWFHGAHHVTSGEGFAGDHTDLYTRIYEAIIEDYDAAAEKGVGLIDESVACPIKVMELASKIISKCKSPCDLDSTEIAEHGSEIVSKYLKFLDHLYHSLEEKEALTLGLDDFIMAMANNFETFAYLLKQRSSK